MPNILTTLRRLSQVHHSIVKNVFPYNGVFFLNDTVITLSPTGEGGGVITVEAEIRIAPKRIH